MIVNNGLRAIRDAVRPIVTNMKAGTDNTPTMGSMNDLVASVFDASGSITNVNGNTSGKSLHRMRMTTAQGNGNTFKEIGCFIGGGDMLLRETHPGVVKDASKEILYEVQLEVVNV